MRTMCLTCIAAPLHSLSPLQRIHVLNQHWLAHQHWYNNTGTPVHQNRAIDSQDEPLQPGRAQRQRRALGRRNKAALLPRPAGLVL